MRLGFFETWALSDSVRFHPRLEEPGSFFTLCFHLYLLQLEWYVTFTSTTKSSIYSIRNFCLSCYVFCSFASNIFKQFFCPDIGDIWADYYSPIYAKFVIRNFCQVPKCERCSDPLYPEYKMIIKTFFIGDWCKAVSLKLDSHFWSLVYKVKIIFRASQLFCS